jgi:hypothetical protein
MPDAKRFDECGSARRSEAAASDPHEAPVNIHVDAVGDVDGMCFA